MLTVDYNEGKTWGLEWTMTEPTQPFRVSSVGMPEGIGCSTGC